jgi:hypothetical protein
VRPLSKLQQTVLRLAWEDPELTVAAWMVKVVHYDFRPVRQGRLGHSIRFSRQEIGLNRYSYAGVAITTTFARLVRRGLATGIQGQAAIRLTRAGVIAAQRLAKGELL